MAISMKEIKEEIKNNSANKSKILFFKKDTHYRIRFLNDFEDGVKIPFHNNFAKKINIPCQEVFGRDCDYCDDEELKLKNMFCWSVFEYESGEVKLLLFAVNQCSPVQVIAEAYERYGTLLDRDYDLKQLGEGTSKTFSLFPGDKRDFKNKKVKPLSSSGILKIIDKAYPTGLEGGEEDEEDGEKEYRKTEKKRKEKEGYMNKPEEEGDDWGEDEKPDYDSMKPRELFDLCKERGIECPVKKSKQFYIDLLEQADEEEGDDWGENEDELPFH